MQSYSDDELELADLFGRSLFMVPKYQREYSWETEHVEDLINDIQFVLNRKKNNSDVEHYFGTVVLERRDEVEVETETFTKYSIVDGQQRITTHTILVQCLLEEIEWIEETSGGDITGESSKWRSKYIKDEGEDRLELGSISQKVFKDLVIKGKNPETVSEEVEHSAGKKLVNTKKVITEKIRDWRSEYVDSENEEDLKNYRDHLNDVLKVSTNDLKVTVKTIDDMDEAARMFKVINNRGKDLTTFDKVKSHMVYAASRSNMDAEKAYDDFGKIVRNVTKYEDCGDEELDNLVKDHWTLFAGEPGHVRNKRPGPKEIDKRLSHIHDYANVDDNDIQKFIRKYIDSLKEVSDYYVHMTNPELFEERYGGREHTDEISRKLQVFKAYNAGMKAYAPVLITVVYNYGIDSEKLSKLVDAIETLCLRYNIVLKEGTDPYRNTFYRMASDMFWAKTSDTEIEEIFRSEKDRYKGYESSREGLESIVDELKSRVNDLCPDGKFEEYILKKDVIEGEFESGYGGMRSTSGIMYILHEYEKHLRGESDTEINGLVSFTELEENFELEHLVPKNAESGHKLQSHRKNRNRIGNLAFIGKKDNKKYGNSPYKVKYEQCYQDSSYKILNELDGPKISTSEVQQRGERIADFAVKRWQI